MSKKSFFLRVFGAVALILVGLFLGLGMQERLGEIKTANNQPQSTIDEDSEPVSVMIDSQEDILAFPGIKISQDDTVFSVLRRLAEAQPEKVKIESQDYGDMGVLINAINGSRGGEDNKYWQYWINNAYGQVAADKQPVKGGDIIMWKFTSSKYEEIK